MQKKKTFRWPSTKKQENGNTSMPSTPIETSSQSPRYFRTITELPLFKYIECSVDKNLSALTISGFPTEKELFTAWADINEQYSDMMGDAEHKLYLSVLVQMTCLSMELEIVQRCIALIRKYDFQPFKDRLNALLFTNYKFTDKKEKELQICNNLSQSIIVNLDLKKMQFDSLKEKHEQEGKEPTREYYQSILVTLSDFAKYNVDDKITTYQFCERVKRFTEFIKNKKAQNGRR